MYLYTHINIFASRVSFNLYDTCLILIGLESWGEGDRLPEFLHLAVYHHEPPGAPQSKGGVFLLQRAHHHTADRPDGRRAHLSQIGQCINESVLLHMRLLWHPAHFRLPFVPSDPLQKGFDVFNALDLMENKTFLEKLKFGIGDGNLQYYLYNWKCPSMGPEKVWLLLLKIPSIYMYLYIDIDR